jgi:hypothetical protein
MGYVAAIGAVASLVASGVSAYSSSQKGKSAGGAVIPQVKLSGISLPSAAHGFEEYNAQQSDLYGLNTTATAADAMSNQEFQDMLTKVDPDLMKQISSIGSLATSYLSGQIPQDVQDQIQRATAQQAMSGGYAGTQMARNLTSRDLGLTSLDLQQKGIAASQTAANMARGVTPSYTAISSLLFTPAQLLARQDQASYYNTDIKNQQAIANAGNQLAAQMYASKLQSSSQAGTSSAINQGINSLFGSGTTSGSKGGALGSIMSLFGSGSGSGGNSGFSMPNSGFSGLSDSDMSSVIGGGFSSGGLEAEDFAALGAV